MGLDRSEMAAVLEAWPEATFTTVWKVDPTGYKALPSAMRSTTCSATRMDTGAI